jgi:dihydrofolate reductase
MVTIIVAMDNRGLIGVDNGLPWRLSADLQHFKKLTSGNAIIMGRVTWDSLGRPLPHRHNIVITRNSEFRAEGCTVVSSLEEAIKVSGEDKAFIIGGAQIYKLALDLADEMILTKVDTEAKGDTWFPEIDCDKWELVCVETHQADAKNEHDYNFCTYHRK